MTTEFDLGCVNCEESLTRREVAAEALGFATPGEVEVAECPDCGSRYFPDATLKRLQT
ncbi:hypothetical protein [Halorussus amylolyticus]|uniref:hypothetical protein n=1 Tax=Halorussus amylolyticus TaxID=1126242 RepID=UPI00192F75BA|nr:hypothetical protein [Halorussus amylolyticus]